MADTKNFKDIEGSLVKKVTAIEETNRLIIVVLFLAFAGIFVTVILTIGGMLQISLANKQSSFENLQDEVQNQNAEIKTLTHEIEILQRDLSSKK